MIEDPGYSQRAKEVARDLIEQLSRELQAKRLEQAPVLFHLDGTGRMLDPEAARAWIWESVDEGFPDMRYYLESTESGKVVVNLAAFEDPDSQFHAP